jgi:hypothetical protein
MEDPFVDLWGSDKPVEPEMPVHRITVTRAEYEPHDEARSKLLVEWGECDYEIDHGACRARGDECIVESTVRELGMHGALYGVWDTWEQGNRVTVGVYRVRGWVSKYDVPGEPIEYDAGIELVDEDEECGGE